MISFGLEVDDAEPSDVMVTNEVTPPAEIAPGFAMEEID